MAGSEVQPRIDLARERPFRLGALTVIPAHRQVVGQKESETLEPRVMQVLVALGQAGGEIVGRDDLIERCWDGRVVGDNAINRVISRIRQLAAGIGKGSFAIETITKVGYRLEQTELPARPRPSPSPTPARFDTIPVRRDRRSAILAVGAAGVGAAAYLFWPARLSPARRKSNILYQAGLDVQHLGNVDSTEQAITYFTRATAVDPGFAEAWGALAFARLQLLEVLQNDDRTAAELAEGVRRAATRALQIEPRNRQASLALVLMQPYFRNWIAVEDQTRSALPRMPDRPILHMKLGRVLSQTGRWREAVAELTKAVTREPLVPDYQVALWRALWGVGDIPAARRRIDQAYARWPANLWVWASRFQLLTAQGKLDEATAMGEGRSVGLSPDSPVPIPVGLLCARAFAGQGRADRLAAVDAIVAARKAGAIASAFSISYLAGLGAIDLAFAHCYDYYFGHRDPVTGERQPVTTLAERETYILFQPPAAAMRADPRFAKLTAALGLDDYWRATGSHPDLRRV